MIRKTSMMLGMLVLLLAASAASAANEVYLDPPTVYIPECGNATVQVLLNATNTTDTWSTKIGFDNNSVNITNVTFADSISTNASWGYHGDHIYLGGVSLENRTGNGLLLATLMVECNGSCGPVDLNIMGEEGVERLIAGPPDDTEPHNGTIHAAAWTDGSAQCVDCGDTTIDGKVRASDGRRIFHNISYGVTISNLWTADVTGDGKVRASDGRRIFRNLSYGIPLNCTYCR
jgi:hypothetical protein